MKDESRERIIEMLSKKAIEPNSRSSIMSEYSITDKQIEEYEYKNLNRTEKRMNEIKVSELSKKEVSQLKKTIKSYADASNRKLKRVIYDNFESDKDYVDMVSSSVSGMLNEVYKNIGKGFKVNSNIVDKVSNNDIGVESRLIGRNSYRSKETLYKSLEIDVNKINIENLTKYEAQKIRSELFNLKDPSSLRKMNIGSKAILKRDQMLYRDKIKKISEAEDEWNEKVKSSKIRGDIPVTFMKGSYSIEEGAGNFEKYSKYKESIDKKARLGYKEWRISVVMENYIEAAFSTMPIEAALELEEIVRQFELHDFEMLSKSSRIGEIYFVYAVGAIDYNIILSGLRDALSKV